MHQQIIIDKQWATSCFEENNYTEILKWLPQQEVRIPAEKISEYINQVNQGCRFQVLLGNYDLVKQHLESLHVLGAESLATAPILEIDLYYTLAEAYYYTGDFEKAKHLFSKVLPLKDKHFPYDSIKSKIGLGKCFWKQGYYGKAVMTYLNVLKEMLANRAIPNYHIAKILNLIGIALLDMGEEFYHLAMPFLIKSLKIYENSVLSEDHLYYATCLGDLGYGYLRCGIKKIGNPIFRKPYNVIERDFFKKALTVFKKYFRGHPHRLTATVYKFLAHLKRVEGKLDQTLNYLHLEEEIRAAILPSKHPTITRIYNHKSGVYIDKKLYEEAWYWAEKAFTNANGQAFQDELKNNIYDRLHNEQFGALPVLLKTFYNKAFLLLKQYEVETKAFETLQQADDLIDVALLIIEYLRQSFHEDGKLVLTKQTRGLNELALDIYFVQMKLEDQANKQVIQPLIERIFNVAQISKGLLLLESIPIWKKISRRDNEEEEEATESHEKSIKPILRKMVRQLNTTLNQAIDVSDMDIPSRMLEPIEHLLKVDKKKKEKEQWRIPLKKVQAELNINPPVGILSYFLGKENYYGILITENTVDIKRLAFKGREHHERFRGYCEEFREVISVDLVEELKDTFIIGDEPITEAKENYIRLGHFIYSKLIGPFEHQTNLLERLYIIPDEYLAMLPFDALLTKKVTPDVPFPQLPYLINKFNLAYHFAIAILYYNHKEDNKLIEVDDFMGVASFSEEEDIAFIHEINNLKSFLTTTFDRSLTFLENNEVSQENVLKNLPLFDIVHLSAHGLNNAKWTESWGIILHKNGSKNKENWEVLHIDNLRLEITNMEAQLVVLHSCSTGVGEIVIGEGVMALNRTFIRKGTKNIIYSLNEIPVGIVDDILLPFYYKLILEQKSISVALREAKLERIKDKLAIPNDWAGLVYMGNQLTRFQKNR